MHCRRKASPAVNPAYAGLLGDYWRYDTSATCSAFVLRGFDGGTLIDDRSAASVTADVVIWKSALRETTLRRRSFMLFGLAEVRPSPFPNSSVTK